jgi:hypothetical protein
MSVLGTPWVAAAAARVMQSLAMVAFDAVTRREETMFPQLPGNTQDITIPTSIAPARAVVYRPTGHDPRPPVHVNFHGGGYVMRGVQLDDPLCRYLAAEAGVVVVNVDYAVAPQHRFPAHPAGFRGRPVGRRPRRGARVGRRPIDDRRAERGRRARRGGGTPGSRTGSPCRSCITHRWTW